MPRLFYSPISLSDPLCSVCTAAARLAGGEFQGDRGGRGFSSQMCAKHGLGSKRDGGGGSRPLENTLSKHPAAGCGLRTVPRQVTATNTHTSPSSKVLGVAGTPPAPSHPSPTMTRPCHGTASCSCSKTRSSATPQHAQHRCPPAPAPKIEPLPAHQAGCTSCRPPEPRIQHPPRASSLEEKTPKWLLK